MNEALASGSPWFALSQAGVQGVRAMKTYGEPFPETPELKRYVEEWLTREVRSQR